MRKGKYGCQMWNVHNCSKSFMGICQKHIWLPNREYLRDYRCERTDMAYKHQIFETVNLTLHGHYTHVCTVSKVIGIRQNLSARPGIHKWLFIKRINMIVKCIVYMHITAIPQRLLAYLFKFHYIHLFSCVKKIVQSCVDMLGCWALLSWTIAPDV